MEDMVLLTGIFQQLNITSTHQERETNLVMARHPGNGLRYFRRKSISAKQLNFTDGQDHCVSRDNIWNKI